MKTLTRPDITHFLKIGATYVVHCICANVHEWKMRGRAGIGINCWVVARCIVADFRLQRRRARSGLSRLSRSWFVSAEFFFFLRLWKIKDRNGLGGEVLLGGGWNRKFWRELWPYFHSQEVKLRKSYSFPPAKNKFKVARAMCLPTLKRIIRKWAIKHAPELQCRNPQRRLYLFIISNNLHQDLPDYKQSYPLVSIFEVSRKLLILLALSTWSEQMSIGILRCYE